MQRFVRLLVLGGLLSALVALAPGASAATVAACQVDGKVTLTTGLSETPTHDTYTFTQTSLSCTGTGAINGLFNVTATGNTTGDPVGGTAGAGEDCDQGRSDGAGTLTATQGANSSSNGTVSFTRAGGTVSATGGFTYLGTSYSFQAALQFTPDPVTDIQKCSPTVPGTIKNASLQGAAEVSS